MFLNAPPNLPMGGVLTKPVITTSWLIRANDDLNNIKLCP